MNDPCTHMNVYSIFIAETDDHVTLCMDCRTVVHWCNHHEDEWRELEESRPLLWTKGQAQ